MKRTTTAGLKKDTSISVACEGRRRRLGRVKSIVSYKQGIFVHYWETNGGERIAALQNVRVVREDQKRRSAVQRVIVGAAAGGTDDLP
jgi:hypothetical protein